MTAGIVHHRMAWDDKTAERVRAALARRRAVVEKPMMGSLAFMVDGSMCCAVGREGILFRIDPEQLEAFLDRPHVGPMNMGRRTMRGFVRVAPPGYRTAAALAKWIDGGIAAGVDAPTRKAKAKAKAKAEKATPAKSTPAKASPTKAPAKRSR